MVVLCISGWIPAVGAAPGLGVASPEGPLADIQRVKPSQAFRLAYQDYLKGHFDLALSEFRQFVADFPQSSLAARALYYMGECYEQQGNLKEAARTLSILLEDYGTSRQVPAALFKLGKVMEKTGNSHKAKAYWMTLIKNFQGSPEAKLASHRLKRIP
jgi:tol-pal system protein YbgF